MMAMVSSPALIEIGLVNVLLEFEEEHGLLDHVEDLDHSVMHCYRCGTALEPWLSEQWFCCR